MFKMTKGIVMRARTFLRIMIDNIFLNNPFTKAILALANFCYEQSYYNQKSLNILKNWSLKNTNKQSSYKSRFIFTNTPHSGANTK